MKRTITTIAGVCVATWSMAVCADVTVLAIRLGAKDVVGLAKFYDKAFGLKEIDRVGQPTSEIIMRYGATVSAAKAGSSPEFLLTHREVPAQGEDPMPHAIFRVSDLSATVAAAKSAGATIKSDVTALKIGDMPVKLAMVVDPEGNVIELMELPKTADHIQHP